MLKYFKYVYQLDKLKEAEVKDLLQQLGFDQNESKKMSTKIKNSTLHEIVDTTDIEGSQDSEKWMKSWRKSKREDG